MTQTQNTTRRSTARQMFVVFAASGQTVVVYDSALADELARRTNGNVRHLVRG